MRTKHYFNSTQVLSSLFLISTLLSCGSYQAVSYYASDGIYGGDKITRVKPEQTKTENNTKGVYYKDYFSNVADDYSSIDNPQNYTFTETDSYSSNLGNSNDQVNSQAPWGDRTNKTEIYYINNNPWGYFNYNWGFYNSFYDPFWNYSPFFYRGFYRPYWGLSFYDPFYRLGYGLYGNPYYASRYGYRNYYNNGYDRNYARSSYSRGSASYSNINTFRGGRSTQGNYRSSSSRSDSFNGTFTKSNPSSVSRYNVGRKSNNQPYNSGSNQKVTRKNTNTQPNQGSSYRNTPQSNSSRSYSNSSTRSSRNSNNSERNYNSTRSSYSSGSRSSSTSSIGSRGSSSGSRSSSRGR
jgi:hypothetical protein